MNKKKSYDAPETELVELRSETVILNESSYPSSSVEEADYRSDIGWDS